MALVFNNECIIYYQLDALWSMDVVQTISLTLTIWLSNDDSVPLIHPLMLLTKWGLRPIAMLSSLMDGWAIHPLAPHAIVSLLSMFKLMLLCLL